VEEEIKTGVYVNNRDNAGGLAGPADYEMARSWPDMSPAWVNLPMRPHPVADAAATVHAHYHPDRHVGWPGIIMGIGSLVLISAFIVVSVLAGPDGTGGRPGPHAAVAASPSVAAQSGNYATPADAACAQLRTVENATVAEGVHSTNAGTLAVKSAVVAHGQSWARTFRQAAGIPGLSGNFGSELSILALYTDTSATAFATGDNGTGVSEWYGALGEFSRANTYCKA
jgi:hypothetical protein